MLDIADLATDYAVMVIETDDRNDNEVINQLVKSNWCMDSR